MTKAISWKDLCKLYFDLSFKFNLTEEEAKHLTWPICTAAHRQSTVTNYSILGPLLHNKIKMISVMPLISTVLESNFWARKDSGNVCFIYCEHQTWEVYVWAIVTTSGENTNYVSLIWKPWLYSNNSWGPT